MTKAIPSEVATAIKAGQVNLEDPATTLALLKLDAVVGVKATANADGSLKTIGIQCSLCHSTVDDSFAPGIGNRLDGWPNRDLDVGKIVSLSPDLSPVATFLGVDEATVRTVLASWGPGKFDAELFLDGKAFRPDNKLGHTKVETDLVSSKLPALHAYQLALAPPAAKAGSFDTAAAQRGAALFTGTAKCGSCHALPTGSEPGWNMHVGAEIGIDEFQASRSPDKRYRTTPLRGLWAHAKGGFYHDGRFATLGEVVDHHDSTFTLGLTTAQKADLVEYLKSL